MKNALAKVSTAVLLSQVWAMQAFAALNEPPSNIDGLEDSVNGPEGIKEIIVKLLVIVLDFITLIGVIFVIVAGIRLIVSGGDEGEKDKAKKTILYVVVGIIVVLFARVIVTFFASITD